MELDVQGAIFGAAVCKTRDPPKGRSGCRAPQEGIDAVARNRKRWSLMFREQFLAQRSAGCEARPRAEADAGHRKRALIPLTERKALELDVQEAIFGAAVCKTQGPHQGPKRMQGTARGR